MADEPFETIGNALAEVIQDLIAETVTADAAGEIIAGLFQDAYPTETDKLTIIQSFVARLPGVNVGDGPPDPAFGQIGSQYLDEVNFNFYRSKTAEGWGDPVPFLGAPGEDGTSFLDSVRDVLAIPGATNNEALAAHAVLVAEELAAEGLISGSGAHGNFTASGAGTTLTVSEPVTEASTLDLTKNGLPQVAGEHFSANGTNVITLSTAYAAGDKFAWCHVGGRAAAPQQIPVVPMKGTGETDGNLARAAVDLGEDQSQAVQFFGEIEVDGVSAGGSSAGIGYKDEASASHTVIKGSGPGKTVLKSKPGSGQLNLVRQQNTHADTTFLISDLTLDGTDKIDGNVLSAQDSSNFAAKNVVLIGGGITNRQNDNTRTFIVNALTKNSQNITLSECESWFGRGHGFAVSGTGSLFGPYVRWFTLQNSKSIGSAGSGLNVAATRDIKVTGNWFLGKLDDVTGNFIYRYAAIRVGNESFAGLITGNFCEGYYRGLRLADSRFYVACANYIANMGQQAVVFEQKDSEGHHNLVTASLIYNPCRGFLHPIPEADGEEEPSNTTERMGVYQGGGAYNVIADTSISADYAPPAHGLWTGTTASATIRVVDNTEVGQKISAGDRRIGVGTILFTRGVNHRPWRPDLRPVGKVASKPEKLWYSNADGTGRPIGRGDSRVPDPNILLLTDNPFSTTFGSATVVVNKTAHGLSTGDLVTFYGVKAFNGIDFLNTDTGRPKGPYAITVINADSFSIQYGLGLVTDTGSGGGAGADNACGMRVTNSAATTTKGLLGTDPLETVQTTLNNPLTTFRPTLGTDPIVTNVGSSIVLVNHTAHGKAVGEEVRFAGLTATPIGGIPHTEFTGPKVITNVLSPNAYMVEIGGTDATSSAAGGGGAVTVGSSRVHVAIAAHGKATGEKIRLGGVTGNPGGASDSLFNKEHTITVVDANTVAILLTAPVIDAAAGVGGASVTLLTDEIKVTDTGHGMTTGAYARLNHKTAGSTLSSFNGIAIDNRSFRIVVIDANSYKMICESAATSGSTGGGANIARSWVPKSAGQDIVLDGKSLRNLSAETLYYRTPELEELFYHRGTGTLTVDDANANISGSGGSIFLTQLQAKVLLFDNDKRLLAEVSGASSDTVATAVTNALRDFSGPGWFFNVVHKMTHGILLAGGEQTVMDRKSIHIDGATVSPIKIAAASIMREADIPRSAINIPKQTLSTVVPFFLPLPADLEDRLYRPVRVRFTFLEELASPDVDAWAYAQLKRIRAGAVTLLTDLLIPLGLSNAQAVGDQLTVTLPDTPAASHQFEPGDIRMLELVPFGGGRALPAMGAEVWWLEW